MEWKNNGYIWLPRYRQVTWGKKQAYRYERAEDTRLPVLRVSVKRCEASNADLCRFILLGDKLGVPAKYEFTEPQQQISFELISAQALRQAIS
jgi:hypothetical protein